MVDFRDYKGMDASTFLMHYGVGHEHGIDSRQAIKQLDKLGAASKEEKVTREQLKKSEAETWKIIAELNEKGYDLSSKKVLKDAAGAKAQIAQALGGAIGQAIYRTKTGTGDFVEGNKFKVREKRGDDAAIQFDNRDLTKNDRVKDAKAKGIESASKEQLDADHDGDEYDENMANQLNNHKGRYPWGYESNDQKSEKYGGIFNRKKAEKYDYQAEEAKRQKQLDEAIERYSKGNDAEKAWVKVLEIDKKKDSYKTQEEYERDRGKALDAYETVFKNTSPAYKAHEKHKQFVNKSQKNRLTSSQQERFDRAKSKDLWDMEFLEMYQPEEKWETSQALREYKAYLLDPEEWKKGR